MSDGTRMALTHGTTIHIYTETGMIIIMYRHKIRPAFRRAKFVGGG
jgi:hypothetical protein